MTASGARRTIGIVTSSAYPDLPDDERFLSAAIRARGYDAVPVIWDDAAVRWDRFDACIVRSTWDFHLRHRAFESWIERAAAATRLVNPAPLMRWNVSKRYLLEIEARGVPIVPTVVLSAARADPNAIARDQGWTRFVLKPDVSASAYRTAAFEASHDASDFLRLIHTAGDALLQPFVPDVLAGGERSYVVVDGALTHVVRRAAFNGGAHGAVQPRVEPLPDERGLAMQVLSVLPARPAYARIDIVRMDSGVPVIAEVELIEPSLFFGVAPEAADRLAGALVALVEG